MMLHLAARNFKLRCLVQTMMEELSGTCSRLKFNFAFYHVLYMLGHDASQDYQSWGRLHHELHPQVP